MDTLAARDGAGTKRTVSGILPRSVSKKRPAHSMQHPESTDPASTDPDTEVLRLERHGIDYIPLTERHGRPKDLFTLWFGANTMAVTLATGAIAATTGIGLLWGGAALVLGALIGTVFMAYHSAQGPQLGLPQMIQSRAQFGYYGANLPMLVVIAMYLGYTAGGAIIGAKAVNLLFGISVGAAVALITAMSLLLALFGYNMMHWIGRVLTPIYLVVFGLLTVSLATHWHSFPTSATAPLARFELTPFLMILSISAAYYISYGPYVADYSRYLPVETPRAPVFWYTYAGTIASAIWIMLLGAGIQAAFAQDDAMTATVNVAHSTGNWLQIITVLTLVVGLGNIGALNVYGATMSSLTIVTSVLMQAHVSRVQRSAFIIVLATVSGLIGGSARNDFVHAYENFIFFIVTFLIPWSAINLVDYYLLRKGRYVAADMFTPNGQYGRFSAAGLGTYALGCVCQIPFISEEFYTGRIAARLGFDVAWIVGLIVPGVVYYLVARRSHVGRIAAAAAVKEKVRA
jgi:nucleobase:cation symporter-1, NCS1 family